MNRLGKLTRVMRKKLAMPRIGSTFASLSCAKAAALVIIPLTLAACGKVDRLATTASVIPDTVEQRHPIVLAEAPHMIDIFPGNGRLDDGDKGRIADFVTLYKERGRGPITVLLPQGGAGGKHESSVNVIRRALARAGVAGVIRVGHYTVTDPAVAAAVRLSFTGLKAKVATQCGEWPDDLASASSLHTWQNKQYWNFGCSYQNMLAVQVANPRDIASPQGEATSDVRMRMRAIQKVRQGTDPGTTWKVQNSNIGSVGGN